MSTYNGKQLDLSDFDTIHLKMKLRNSILIQNIEKILKKVSQIITILFLIDPAHWFNFNFVPFKDLNKEIISIFHCYNFS
jgi:hypothetical protein